ncbi:MAG TPA: cupin domain-containing protein [Candidatus Binatia bacterium]|jgi:uncharacterized cupin superfamily protein|nr:cupin domain-containing protein [Candidatus Binatia bacterium]
MTTDRSPLLLHAADIAASDEMTFRHPLNPASEIHLRMISGVVGLQRVVLTIGRVPPGRESFVYHSHQHEEEFVFILGGRGLLEIDGTEHEVGPGDFAGFPTPSAAHQLRNPFDTDLVYLMGGERREMEVADFPRLGKRLVRSGSEMQVVDTADLKSFW